MVIKTETKYGGSAKESRDGFALALEADVNEGQLAALAAIGLASLAYRGGASVINKALKVDSNSAAEYSDEGAATVATSIEEWAGKGAGFKVDGENGNPLGAGFVLSVTATRHEHGETGASPMKRATALVDSFVGTPMEGPYRAILGLPDGDRDALIAEANKRGLGISVPKGVAAKKEA
jgi:hypothetical protein